jgi:hypothetical protein
MNDPDPSKQPGRIGLIWLKIEKGDYKIIPIRNTPESQADTLFRTLQPVSSESDSYLYISG